MPAPPSSTQPVFEHTPQPAPSQNTHVIANSTDGSVNGKNDGRKRALTFGPNSAWMNASMVPSRSPSVMPSSTASPSIWWNTGEWRASSVSRRNDAARRDHVDRRLLRFHRPHLHRRGVRAEQHLFGLAQADVERVLHRAGGMAGREVQGFEVVPVELDLGTLGDLVAEPDEHVLELAPDRASTGCRCPRRYSPPPIVRSIRSRTIDSAACRPFELLAARRERAFHLDAAPRSRVARPTPDRLPA